MWHTDHRLQQLSVVVFLSTYQMHKEKRNDIFVASFDTAKLNNPISRTRRDCSDRWPTSNVHFAVENTTGALPSILSLL
jgi:hypothetical protein